MRGSESVQLSVLDLSVLNEGASSGEALSATTALARRADELGFTRFWVAEHHNMASVACTAPSVLIAHIAANTSRIRVGSGGVMLPNHAPLVVAEQFAALEALHPGRIDLGIGRAPGTDHATAAALRRSSASLGAEDFPRHLLDVMGLLGDERVPDGLSAKFRATPAARSFPQIFLLGSSDFSAQLAGILGLPFAFAHHFDMGGTLEATALYRESFEPSPVLAAPYTIVTANVLAADTTEDAEWHGSSGRLAALRRRTGRFAPLASPQYATDHPDQADAQRLPTNRIVGEVSDVVERLRELARRTAANELMVTSVAFELAAREHSLELLAERW